MGSRVINSSILNWMDLPRDHVSQSSIINSYQIRLFEHFGPEFINPGLETCMDFLFRYTFCLSEAMGLMPSSSSLPPPHSDKIILPHGLAGAFSLRE